MMSEILEDLFNTSSRIHDDLKRNIVHVSKPKDAYKDLISDEDDMEILAEVTQNLACKKSGIHSITDDFYYTAAIEYPFATQPFMQTRFSDGTYPVWYGSDTIETSIYETAHHVQKNINSIEGINTEEIVTMKRTIYDVSCNGILINLTGKEQSFTGLLDDNYYFCNQIGKIVSEGGHPGIISPSARNRGGKNFSVFQQKILTNPRLTSQVEYEYCVPKKRITARSSNFKLEIDYGASC